MLRGRTANVETLTEGLGIGFEFFDSECLVDEPWLTVMKLVYPTGTRYDIVACAATEADDIVHILNEVLPVEAIRTGAWESQTLPEGVAGEITVSYWAGI